jgi:integrase
MSVHTLADGRFYVHYRDRQNKGKWKRKYFGRGLEAEKKANDFNDSLNLRKHESKDTSKPFEILVNAYMDAKVSKVQKSTLDNFLWKMDGVILPTLGRNIRAMAMTHERMDRYVNDRLKAKNKNGGTIKRTTVHRELSDIRAVLNWAAKRRYIAFNPLKDYEMPKRDDDDTIHYPTAAEIAGILRHAPEQLSRAVKISYYTGLRPGRRELFSMQWCNIDFDAATITVKSAKKGGKYKFREVPIHPDFLAELRTWYLKDGAPDGYIVHYRGRPVKSLKKSFAAAKRKAKIKRRLRLYDIRHCFASLLLKHHADLKSTSELLGHSRPDTTMKFYQHTDAAMHRDAISRLPAIDTTVIPQESGTIKKAA